LKAEDKKVKGGLVPFYRRKSLFQRRLNEKRDQIKKLLSSEPTSGDDVVCIKVKFSGGEVFSRKFRTDDSLEVAFFPSRR
jgi:hypothetical protein